jgi:hypothetical protein
MEEQPEPPKPLAERPELYLDLHPVWECFWFLHPSRPMGMEAGAIPLTEIIAYWRDAYGILDQADLAEKIRLVRCLDNVFLRHSKESNDGV